MGYIAVGMVMMIRDVKGQAERDAVGQPLTSRSAMINIIGWGGLLESHSGNPPCLQGGRKAWKRMAIIGWPTSGFR